MKKQKKEIAQQPQEVEAQVRVEDIALLKVAIIPTDEIRKLMTPTKFHYDYSINTSSDEINRNKLLVSVSIVIREDHTKKKAVVGEFAVGMAFIIENEGVVTIDKVGNAAIPNGLLFMFVSLTLSTARGMMAGEFKGTILSKAYFPIIDTRVLAENLAKAIVPPVL